MNTCESTLFGFPVTTPMQLIWDIFEKNPTDLSNLTSMLTTRSTEWCQNVLLRLETSRFCKGPDRPRHSFIGNFDKTVHLMAATLIRYGSEWVRVGRPTISSRLFSVPDSFRIISASCSNFLWDASGSKSWSSFGPKHRGKLQRACEHTNSESRLLSRGKFYYFGIRRPRNKFPSVRARGPPFR